MSVIKKYMSIIFNYLKHNPYITATVIVLFALLFTLISFLFITNDEINLPFSRAVYYNVSFEYNNGQEVVRKKIKKGKKVTKPEDPILGGYTFIGWYKDDKIYDFNLEVECDFTLVAKYLSSDGTIIENNVIDKPKDEASSQDKGEGSDKTNNQDKINDQDILSDKNNPSDKKDKEENKDNSSTDGENNVDDKDDNNIPVIPPGEDNPPNNPVIPPDIDSTSGCVAKGSICGVDSLKEGVVVTMNLGGVVNNFYVLSNTQDTMTLMLASNFGSTTAWITAEDYRLNNGSACIYGACNYLGAITASRLVKSFTSSARLPQLSEINALCSGGCPCWIFDNLGGNTPNYCPNNKTSNQRGYWLMDKGLGNISQAKFVSGNGYVDEADVLTADIYGVRPVITVNK